MSWDDIEIKVSDVIGSNLPTHPVQLVMSSDRRVELPAKSIARTVKCHHPSSMAYQRSTMANVSNDETEVVLHLYGINNVPVPEQTDFDWRGRMPVWHVLWAMGLCDCGTLYWKHVDTVFDIVVRRVWTDVGS